MTPLALDIAVGIIIFLSILIGFFRGIIKEVFTLVGLGLATFISYKGGHMLVPGLNKWLNVPTEGSKEKVELVMGLLSPAMASKVTAYGGTFLLVFLIVMLIGYLMTHWIKEMGLGVVDRTLGAGFGFARGFLLVFLCYVPITYAMEQEKMPVWMKESKSVPILQDTLVWANESLDLDKIIEKNGDGIKVKFDKIDPDKIGDGVNKAEEELKESIQQEEKNIQMGVPVEQPQAAPVPEVSPLP